MQALFSDGSQLFRLAAFLAGLPKALILIMIDDSGIGSFRTKEIDFWADKKLGKSQRSEVA